MTPRSLRPGRPRSRPRQSGPVPPRRRLRGGLGRGFEGDPEGPVTECRSSQAGRSSATPIVRAPDAERRSTDPVVQGTEMSPEPELAVSSTRRRARIVISPEPDLAETVVGSSVSPRESSGDPAGLSSVAALLASCGTQTTNSASAPTKRRLTDAGARSAQMVSAASDRARRRASRVADSRAPPSFPATCWVGTQCRARRVTSRTCQSAQLWSESTGGAVEVEFLSRWRLGFT